MAGPNLTIFRKGLLLVGLPIAFQLIFLAVMFHLQAMASEADRWALHTKEVMAQADEAYRLLTESVSQMRGAVITGDANFAPELLKADAQALPALQRLEGLVSDNPPQQQRVAEFRAGALQLLKWVNDERAMVAAGNRAAAFAHAADPERGASVEKLHQQLQSILELEQQLDRKRVEEMAAGRRREAWFIAISAGATIIIAAGTLAIFTNGIAARLAVLADNASRLAQRRPLTTSFGGSDEIARVGQAFGAAAAQLAEADAAEQRYRDELEKRAAELALANADLGRANADLRFKTQENETFVYSVSHDLRSPLVNLQGFGKELAQSCKELRSSAEDGGVPAAVRRRMLEIIDGDVLESIRFIQTAVSRSGNIIDSLLRLSRAGRVEYKRQPVDVRSIVQRVADSMQASARERNAQVVINDLPEAMADPAAVEQIFGNLIGNAINYLDRSRPCKIEVGALAAEDQAPGRHRYYVRDNGVGIPAAYLPKMFVAFQRLHGQLAPGEGIGLALVRRVVERLEGTVSVESTEGVGSTFFVTLPAAEPQPTPETHRAEAPPPGGSPTLTEPLQAT